MDFIIRSVEDILRDDFGASLSGAGVNVLDPFTGTGTFITRLIESGYVRPEDLPRKYESELYATEIVPLAYSIATENIEMAYHHTMWGGVHTIPRNNTRRLVRIARAA